MASLVICWLKPKRLQERNKGVAMITENDKQIMIAWAKKFNVQELYEQAT